MKGDFTRDTFDPRREFYRVLIQQGRVQLDADWNEQISILLHRIETLAIDIFGAHGGPAMDCGFAVFEDENGIWLSRGRYYVEGLQCENHEVLKLEPPRSAEKPEHSEAHIVYLDAFEEYVPAAADPRIAEVALGSLDTAARSRIRWVVKFRAPSEEAPVGERGEERWRREWERMLPEVAALDRQGLLRARTSSNLGYTGSQNQLYRVEIHQGGPADGRATWKWSRENGSVAFAASIDEATVEVKAGPNGVGAFSVGDWIEIVSDEDFEDGEHKRPLRQVKKVDPGTATLTLDSSPGTFESREHPIVRRWDQRTNADGSDLASSGGCLPLVEDEWLTVESNIEILFKRAGGGEAAHRYRGGDYWNIPARATTAAIEWPKLEEESEALPPRGVLHRYAPLAVVAVRDGAHKAVHDFRIRCKPLSMMT